MIIPSASAQYANEYTFPNRVFFYCSEQAFQHLSIGIAEGFKELGIPFYSNINYWKTSPEREEYLFNHDPSVSPDNCSVVVLSYQWFNHNSDFPENLFHAERKYITVYLDDMDGPTIWNPELRAFDFVFRTHYNRRSPNPSNCIPWVFGLSNRILKETSTQPEFQDRNRNLLFNFRNDHELLDVSHLWLRVPQGLIKIDQGVLSSEYPLRRIVRDRFLPLIRQILLVDDKVDNFETHPADSYHYLQWTQTGHRHYPNYYQRLGKSAACACFGGWMVPNPLAGENLVEWWDSWRFWESLAAGCVTFHVDFDKYGISLPVMPENWRHYVGIDLDNIQDTVDRIANDPEILARISLEGRRWAIENYSPVPTALRFLETLGFSVEAVSQANAVIFSTPIHLREINLILFPDWQQPEESFSLSLEQVLRTLFLHPDKNKIALLIDTSGISSEEANLVISSVTMNLMMQEDLDVTEGPEISLLGQMNPWQWKAIQSRVSAHLVLENENKLAIAQAQAENIPLLQL